MILHRVKKSRTIPIPNTARAYRDRIQVPCNPYVGDIHPNHQEAGCGGGRCVPQRGFRRGHKLRARANPQFSRDVRRLGDVDRFSGLLFSELRYAGAAWHRYDRHDSKVFILGTQINTTKAHQGIKCQCVGFRRGIGTHRRLLRGQCECLGHQRVRCQNRGQLHQTALVRTS